LLSSTVAPRLRKIAIRFFTSLISGTFFITQTPETSRAEHTIGKIAFFDPLTAMLPDKALPPCILNEDIWANYTI
jgi:hypothetical protein